MPTHPFCKPKPAPELPRSPLMLTLPRKTIAQMTDKLYSARGPIIDITVPWDVNKPAIKPQNKVQQAMYEYAVAYPNARTPSTTDLIEWMYERMVVLENRTLTAESRATIAEIDLKIERHTGSV